MVDWERGMLLYLVQHAEAKRDEEDARRPLTERGFREIERMARYAEAHLKFRPSIIFHSGRLRAQQTAEVLAQRLRPPKGIQVEESLGPLADPQPWKQRLDSTEEDVMLVGHLPHLSRLVSLLLGVGDREVVAFRMGGILCMKREEKEEAEEARVWRIAWMINPDLIPSEV